MTVYHVFLRRGLKHLKERNISQGYNVFMIFFVAFRQDSRLCDHFRSGAFSQLSDSFHRFAGGYDIIYDNDFFPLDQLRIDTVKT